MSARRTRDEAGRPYRTYVRLSEAERVALSERAGAAGVSVGRFLVEQALGDSAGPGVPSRVVVGELFGIRRELAGLRGARSVDPSWGSRLEATVARLDAALAGLGGTS